MECSEEISNKLNDLIEKNINAKDAYAKAIEKVENPEIKNFFKERAKNRARFVKELRTEVWGNGEIPENSGNISGEVHRNWMSLKAIFSSNDEEAMLNETIRGEKTSLEEYNQILSEIELPKNIENLIIK
ncbi:ferritin-like domain-containing protein [Winogradskyella sp.]|uniref:ferritin-like domain-containing protein n=1 Tax=Winogradskyella sp. TaxID=1883156 RepID=UPI003F6D0BF3